MVAVQRAADVEWTGSIARGSGRVSGGSGALGDLPITVASRSGEPEGKTSPEELTARWRRRPNAAARCHGRSRGTSRSACTPPLEGPPASSGSAPHEA
jgi:hypothetical protein